MFFFFTATGEVSGAITGTSSASISGNWDTGDNWDTEDNWDTTIGAVQEALGASGVVLDAIGAQAAGQEAVLTSGAVSSISSVSGIDVEPLTAASSDLSSAQLADSGTRTPTSSVIEASAAQATGTEALADTSATSDASAASGQAAEAVLVASSPSSVSSALGFALMAARMGSSVGAASSAVASIQSAFTTLLASSLSQSSAIAFPSGNPSVQSSSQSISSTSVSAGTLREGEATTGVSTASTDVEGSPAWTQSLHPTTVGQVDRSTVTGASTEAESTSGSIIGAGSASLSSGHEKVAAGGSAISTSAVGPATPSVVELDQEVGASQSQTDAEATLGADIETSGGVEAGADVEGIPTELVGVLSVSGDSESTSDVEDRVYAPILGPTRVLVNAFRTMEFA